MKIIAFIILTMLSTPRATEVRKAVAVDDFQIVLNRTQILQTMDHMARLAEDAKAKQDTAEASLKTALAQNAQIQQLKDSANYHASEQDKTINGLKSDLFWARWKFGIIGTIVGIVVAISVFVFSKAGLWLASAAAKVGIKAAIPI